MQDVHELLIMLLDLVESSSIQFKPHRSMGLRCLLEEVEEAKQMHSAIFPPNLTFSQSCPFVGMFASMLVCNSCHTQSPIQLTSFTLLSLAFPEGCTDGRIDVMEMVEYFQRPEHLDNVTCQNCGVERSVNMTKLLRIAQFPPVFCLHLLRVQYDNFQVRKIHTKVDFPLVLTLQVDDFLPNVLPTSAPQPQPLHFALSSVITHEGGPHSGHYITYRAVEYYGRRRWFRISDEFVSMVSTDHVLGVNPYLLFYERLETSCAPLHSSL